MATDPDGRRRALALMLLKTRNSVLHNATPYAPRALQWDAVALNTVCENDLFGRIANAFSSRMDIQDIADEVKVLLKSMVFYFTVGRNRPTPGQALLNLHYTNLQGSEISKMQKACLFACSILVPYLFSKFSKSIRGDIHRLPDENTERCEKLQWLCQCAYACFSLLNSLHFLTTGRYIGLAERLSRVVCRSVEGQTLDREMERDLTNRGLVWHQICDMLLLLMSLLRTHAATNVFAKFGLLLTHPGRMLHPGDRYCPACMRLNIENPFVCVPCGHTYCYYCIASRLCATGRIRSFRCLRCERDVQSIKRSR